MNIKNIYLWNYLQRIINSLGGLILAVLMSAFYSVREAGEFYAIYSVLGIVTIFEFGYSVLVLQRMSKYSGVDHSKYDFQRSKELQHYLNSIKIFIILFLLFFPVISYFILKSVTGELLLFIASLTLFLSINMYTSFLGNVIEGLGYIEKIAKIRVAQAMFTYGPLLVSLLLGLGAKSIIIQVLFQSVTLLVLIKILIRNKLKYVFMPPSKDAETQYCFINVSKVKFDLKYSSQLYITVLATLFSNQVWVIAVSLNGAVHNISKVAMFLQIIAAATGFALTPIAARLAEIAKNHYQKDKEITLLIKKVSRDVIISTVVVLIGSIFLYNLGRFFYPDKLLEPEAAFYFMLSIPIIIFTNCIGILVQSKGEKDILFVSLFRIFVPSVFFIFMGSETSSLEVSWYFFVASITSLFVALYYVFKEIK